MPGQFLLGAGTRRFPEVLDDDQGAHHQPIPS
jgi:hypothetical protein